MGAARRPSPRKSARRSALIRPRHCPAHRGLPPPHRAGRRSGPTAALFRPQSVATLGAFFAGYDALALAILANGALSGFSTALLLQLLSALAKEFANAAEIITTALASRALYATPLPATLSAGGVLVIGSMALFEAAGRRARLAEGGQPASPDREAPRVSGTQPSDGRAHEVEPLLP